MSGKVRTTINEQSGIIIRAPLDTPRSELRAATRRAADAAARLQREAADPGPDHLGRIAFDLYHGIMVSYASDKERRRIESMRRKRARARRRPGKLTWANVTDIINDRFDTTLAQSAVQRYAARWRLESSDDALMAELEQRAGRDNPEAETG